MLKKIISGGQTGADQGALHGARVAGVETGGTAPLGWQTETGPNPKLLKHYNLCQSQNSGYAARTEENILAADGTLIFGDASSSGSSLTLKFCIKHNFPVHVIRWKHGVIHPERFESLWNTVTWIKLNNIQTLNVAGNRESRNPGIHIAVKTFIIDLIAKLREGAS